MFYKLGQSLTFVNFSLYNKILLNARQKYFQERIISIEDTPISLNLTDSHDGSCVDRSYRTLVVVLLPHSTVDER